MNGASAAGVQHRDRVGLGEAGQEVEVSVLAEGVRNVVVADLLPVRGDDGQGIAEPGQDGAAALGGSIAAHAPERTG